MIRYRVSRNALGHWEVSYRYNSTSKWFRITAYLHWSEAIEHAFTAAHHRSIQLAMSNTRK